jgi:hypothetical protein
MNKMVSASQMSALQKACISTLIRLVMLRPPVTQW